MWTEDHDKDVNQYLSILIGRTRTELRVQPMDMTFVSMLSIFKKCTTLFTDQVCPARGVAGSIVGRGISRDQRLVLRCEIKG